MIRRPRNFHFIPNTLALRITLAIVFIMGLSAIPVYLVVLSSVTDFVSQNIQRDLDNKSRALFDIVDKRYMNLLKDEKIGNLIEEKLGQVDCLDDLEQYAMGQSIQVAVYQRDFDGKNLLNNSLPSTETHLIQQTIETDGLVRFFWGGRSFYSRQVFFAPWGWNIVLLNDTRVYDSLVHRVHAVYITFGIVWGVCTIFLLTYLIRSVRTPIHSIINPIAKGKAPSYKGVREFEFLSDSIAKMMTMLQQATQDAEESNRKLVVSGTELEALLDNSPVGIVFLDFDLNIQRVNREFLYITGLEQEELLGMAIMSCYPPAEKEREKWHSFFDRLQETESYQMELQLAAKDSPFLWCHIRGRWIDSSAGTEGIVLAVEDITRRRQMEEDLQKVQKLESLGVLAGGIAHDFNNLLGAILGNISHARRRITDDEFTTALLVNSEKATFRASELTQKLLTFSRGGAPVKEQASIVELIKESAEFVLHGTNVSCTYTFEEPLWVVEVDRGQISQVIQNLVINSCQVMRDGGTMNIRCANATVERPGGKIEHVVEVRVADNGPGIETEIIDRIFDPYFSTKTHGTKKGNGLGLSIVHSIISQHEGRVRAESIPGEGSTFIIQLPASPQEVAWEEANNISVASRRKLPSGKKRVLVMDDESLVRMMVTGMLQGIGYEAEEAANGHETIELYKQASENKTPFDVVIMDLTIPGEMGGEKAVAELLALDPNARVIASSGYANSPVLANYQHYGFKASIPKPYDLDQMHSILEEVLHD